MGNLSVAKPCYCRRSIREANVKTIDKAKLVIEALNILRCSTIQNADMVLMANALH